MLHSAAANYAASEECDFNQLFLQEETATSRQLAKVLTELVGEDMIKEWQMLYRAGRVQVMPLALAFMPSPAELHVDGSMLRH